MNDGLSMHRPESHRFRGNRHSLIPATTVLLLCCSLSIGSSALTPRTTTSKPAVNLTSNTESTPFLTGSLTSSIQEEISLPGSISSFAPRTLEHDSSQPHPSKPRASGKNDKRQEPLSTDCLAKRDSITRKRRSGGRAHSLDATNHRETSTGAGHQRLRPKLDLSSIRHPNASLDSDAISSFDGSSEHIPQCTHDGKYEPIQCMMNYCWCVNKYGQAIKNSAASVTERPVCDRNLYESESNDVLVVTGVGAARLKNLLKPSGPKNSGDGNGQPKGSSLGDPDGRFYSRDSEDSEFSRRVGSSPESSLALVPNECAMSRENAVERKSKHSELEGIWIPDCDSKSNKLYAERQCHKSRVCWCVDQVTGLPLRTSEQLTKTPGINCTEIRRIIEVASSKAKQEIPVRAKPSFFHGFSESCDAEKRSEFVLNLISQFRQQLSDYLKMNSSSSLPPRGLTTTNPYRLTEKQVAIWRFALLDMDYDGKLDDREWSKFKVNFKLVERLDNPPKLILPQRDTIYALNPLYILRSQRKCWRDFLEFCGDGDVLEYVSIDQAKWLTCTEIPSNSQAPFSAINDYPKAITSMQNPDGVPDAYTRAAAEARRSSKNPFLGILKPD